MHPAIMLSLRAVFAVSAGRKKGRFATPSVECLCGDCAPRKRVYSPSCESMSSMAPCETPALSGPLRSLRT